MVILMNGKETSKEIKDDTKNLCKIKRSLGVIPRLDIITVGEDEASKVYVRNKIKACNYCEIDVHTHKFPEDVKKEEVKELIFDLNKDKDVHGIMVQEPLPKNLEGISEYVDISKDVDGFTSKTLGKLLLNEHCFSACTPIGIMYILEKYGCEFEGKNVVILGRSKIVGKPLAIMLTNSNATVTLCHSKTKNLEEICKTSDILISAIGKPKFITREFIGDNTKYVVDVGINRDENGKLCGDVDFEDVSEIFNDRYNENYITPVPGGIGPMTVAMLMRNTVMSADASNFERKEK